MTIRQGKEAVRGALGKLDALRWAGRMMGHDRTSSVGKEDKPSPIRIS